VFVREVAFSPPAAYWPLESGRAVVAGDCGSAAIAFAVKVDLNIDRR